MGSNVPISRILALPLASPFLLSFNLTEIATSALGPPRNDSDLGTLPLFFLFQTLFPNIYSLLSSNSLLTTHYSLLTTHY